MAQPEIKFDDIKYADHLLHGNWATSVSEKIVAATHFNREHDLRNVPDFPTLMDMVCCAEMAYAEDCEGELLEMQQQGKMRDWILLTTANDNGYTNGYFGAAFYHPSNKQVIIAHRGTVLDTFKNKFQAVVTDGYGIMNNKYVPQVSSAVTFTLRLLQVLNARYDGASVHFEVFITGHSLGGWLSQITCFAAKYLYWNGKLDFVVVDNVDAGRHCNTVAFESPGCSEMLLKYQESCLNYRRSPDGLYNPHKLEFSIGDLDITTFLTKPSLINEPNIFAGAIYALPRPSIETEDYSSLNLFETHSLLYVKKCVELSGSQGMSLVIDWPNYNIRMLRLLRFRNPIQTMGNERTTVHDDFRRCRFKSILTQREQQFISKFRHINGTELFHHEFSDLDDFAMSRLSGYEIDLHYLSTKKEEVNSFVSFVRLLLKLKPDLIDKCERFICPKEIKMQFYNIQSDSYIDDYLTWHQLEFNANTDLIDQQCVHFNVPDPLVKVMEIYQDLKHSNSIPFYVLNVKYLSMANGVIKLSDLFESEDESSLFLIECMARDEADYILLNRILDEMSTMLPTRTSVKVILVTDKRDSKMNDIVNRYDEICNIHRLDDSSNDINLWEKLSVTCKKGLVDSLINFQDCEMVLRDLVGVEETEEGSTHANFFNQIDFETILRLKNENSRLLIGMSKREFINFEACCDMLDHEMTKRNLSTLTGNSQNDEIFLIVGDAITLTHGLVDSSQLERAIACKRIQFIDNCEDPREAFKQVCFDNSEKTVYFINRIESESIHCEEVYCPSFYLRREFEFTPKVYLTKNGIRFQLTLSDSNFFVFSNVSSIEELVKHFEVKFKARIRNQHKVGKIIFSDNLNDDVQLEEKHMKETPFVHYIEVEDGPSFVWRRSTGGSLHVIRRTIDKNATKKEFWKEEELIRQCEDEQATPLLNMKTMIIVDEPGMGKSTTMNSLSSELLQSTWVLRVNLKTCDRAISVLRKGNIGTELAVEFFSKIQNSGLETTLAKELLAGAIDGQVSRRVYCLFDAFDEIRPAPSIRATNLMGDKDALQESLEENKEKIIELFEYLQSKPNVLLWITTRESGKHTLEDKLFVLAVKFKRLDQEQQETFLTALQKVRTYMECDSSDQTSESHLESARKVLLIIKDVLGDNSNFIGIPLQLKLLRSIQNLILEGFGAGDVYELFCSLKFKIFMREKARTTAEAELSMQPLCAETLQKYYSYFAFKQLFPGYSENFFDTAKFDNGVLSHLYSIGIIQQIFGEGDYAFCHKTFAEFWIAKAIYLFLTTTSTYRYKGLDKLEEFLITEILLNKDNYVIRLFLNYKVADKTIEPNSSAAKRIADLWEKDELYFFNFHKQTPFHLMAAEKLNALAKFFFNIKFANPTKLYCKKDNRSRTSRMVAMRKDNQDFINMYDEAQGRLVPNFTTQLNDASGIEHGLVSG